MKASDPASRASFILPHEEQAVTVLSVREGHISVLPAKILVSHTNCIALLLELPSAESSRWQEGQLLTILYTLDDHIMRLRSELRDRISDDRITVEPLEQAREGDRRDFRRADISCRMAVMVPSETDTAQARQWQLNHPLSLHDELFQCLDLNISGSGLSFESTVSYPIQTLLDVRLILDEAPERELAIIAQVVRVNLTEHNSYQVALRFCELSEADQDAIIYTVFSTHFSSMGFLDDIL